MPRATTKTELLAASEKRYARLMDFIEALPEADRERVTDLNGRDRNVRDVLCHLHEWHLMLEGWRAAGLKGKTPSVPGEGYTWRTLPALNRRIWEKYQGASLAESMRLLARSHARLLKLVEGHSEAELWKTGAYPWTKSTTLGAYFVSALASHYDWALKTLKTLKPLKRAERTRLAPEKAEKTRTHDKSGAQGIGTRPPLSDPSIFPSDEVLAGILGERAEAALDAFLEENRASCPTFTSEWRFYNDGKRWLMKAQVKKKTVFWLSAGKKEFHATFYLAAAADRDVLAGDFSEESKAGWKASKGKKFRGLTIAVKSKRDLPACRSAEALKLSSE
jgi:hypothetical protein